MSKLPPHDENSGALTCRREFKHVYDWLEEPAADDAERDAKEWLDKFTRPVYDKHEQGLDKWLDCHRLTVNWRGERFECTGASTMGDVWLKSAGSQNFYDHRVNVLELSGWQRESLENKDC